MTEEKMKNYKCECCGLEVDEIPKFKKNECPNDIQHYFFPFKILMKAAELVLIEDDKLLKLLASK